MSHNEFLQLYKKYTLKVGKYTPGVHVQQVANPWAMRCYENGSSVFSFVVWEKFVIYGNELLILQKDASLQNKKRSCINFAKQKGA